VTLYQYSQKNRLEEPHHYMYTVFEGSKFLASYHSSRLDLIDDLRTNQIYETFDAAFVTHAFSIMENRFDQISYNTAKKFKAFLKSDIFKLTNINSDVTVINLASELKTFAVTESINTEELFNSLISTLLVSDMRLNNKIWLDRLVQRFEVTKKIYEAYQPGFRQGSGSSIEVRLYWLFSLALSLYYLKYNEIKYLSTLLKVCDLLCSLPRSVIENTIPTLGLKLVLLAENFSVQFLLDQKGVRLESS